ncbi:flavoprotein [Verrucomicrobia bacterium LW23]|nr:flavoprotein [Verrucomicrobia bacterium LW23]
MNTLVLSTSLRPASNSRIMARYAQHLLNQRSAETEVAFLDLRDHPALPMCDGGDCYSHPEVAAIRPLFARADAIIVAAPVYTFYLSAAAKNVVELTGGAWEDKTVAFLCAAGGASSYMSVMSFANSLMLDFRCVIVPRFVYATGKDFAQDAVADEDVKERIEQLVGATLRLARAAKAA